MANPLLINLQTLIDDAKCFETLRQLRWPEGIICPVCESKHVIKRGFDETQPLRQRYRCKACNKHFDDLSDTIFAGHHQPLRTWILCLYLLGLNLSNHQIHPKSTVTPYGIFLPQLDEVFLYLATSKVTSDFMADTLDAWWDENRERFCHIQTLLINQDNGPENHSRRTQFMKRMVEFSNTHKLNLRLAYYPPYHSKYNPLSESGKCWNTTGMETFWMKLTLS